ncbi:Cilia- and flagella-associated protein 299 [Aduncisulcus paluster]|uniref:Cilia- and flagella-associated protein 299 n=1 Tax=Aduncisulcus paluster TaxID=2918883 RepID=A0ABQ5KSI0_9EUKA|nr:Cilia- and flagella-associated protein 299 [Aduncisulcus paluster]
MGDDLTKFPTYDAFIDAQVRDIDLFYLGDLAKARQLVELGYRGRGELPSREEFEDRKKKARESLLTKITQPRDSLASSGKADLDNYPFLMELAKREEMVRSGKFCCIIFVRDKNHRGQEVSGYIDYSLRLNTEDFSLYFDRKKRLLPRPSDLSFYNWESQYCSCSSSPNFEIIADNEEGLLFKCKRDRKIINVNPSAPPGDNTRRIQITTFEYTQCVIFDHLIRRKV